MARAPQSEREVEQDREDRTNNAGTVMVGGDNIIGDADRPLTVKIEDERPPPKRVVADVERTDQDERRFRDDREDDARLAYDDSEEGIEERRSRRARRNRAHREARTQLADKDQHIAVLSQRLDQLNDVVRSLTQGQTGLTLGTLDNQLNAARQALALADDELARAVAASDGNKFREVQRLRDDAAARVFQLDGAKNQIINDQRRLAAMNGGPPRAPQNQPVPVQLS